MEEAVPLAPNLTMFDISLHKKGPLEDKMLLKFLSNSIYRYSKSDFYRMNIRRGNTLL